MTDDAPPATASTRSALLRDWTGSAIVFLVLSLLGLVGTFAFNALAVVQARDFLGDWFGGGPAVGSLAVDLLVTAVAGGVLLVLEARRLGMRFAWLYLVVSLVTAFAFAFPLFLAMRERRLKVLGR